MEASLARYLKEHSIHYETYSHKAVHTVAESRDYNEITAIRVLVCMTLFLRDEQGQFYLVGLPGEKRLEYKNLQEQLGVKKLTMGSPEELKRETGLIPGSVSIFGATFHPQVTLILDNEVWCAERVCFHPNINTETLVIGHDSLVRYYESLVNGKRVVTL